MERETLKDSAATPQFYVFGVSLYSGGDLMNLLSPFTTLRLETALAGSDVSCFSLRLPMIDSHVLVRRFTSSMLFVSTVPLDMPYP
jgi:hypothetical protein